MTTEDLRRETRVDVRVPVVLLRGKVEVSLATSDVSFKGLFVRTTDPPSLRSLVRLKVVLAGHEFTAHAMAVHVVENVGLGDDRVAGVGLQFWGLSGPDRAAWDEFVGGLVQARRAAAKAKAKAGATPDPELGALEAAGDGASGAMASGVRIVVTTAYASSKS